MKRVMKALDDSGKFFRDAAPKVKMNSPKTTTRDVSTGSLSTAVTVIAVWILHDIAGAEVPPEVAIATGTVIGFFVARKFRY